MKRIALVLFVGIVLVVLFDRFTPSKPVYLHNNRTLELACYSADPDVALIVSSGDSGKTVDVQAGDLKAKLKFVRSSFSLVDYYSNGEVELSLDPEGKIHGGIFGAGYGLCAF